jgi:hypothetical protein
MDVLIATCLDAFLSEKRKEKREKEQRRNLWLE